MSLRLLIPLLQVTKYPFRRLINLRTERTFLHRLLLSMGLMRWPFWGILFVKSVQSWLKVKAFSFVLNVLCFQYYELFLSFFKPQLLFGLLWYEMRRESAALEVFWFVAALMDWYGVDAFGFSGEVFRTGIDNGNEGSGLVDLSFLFNFDTGELLLSDVAVFLLSWFASVFLNWNLMTLHFFSNTPLTLHCHHRIRKRHFMKNTLSFLLKHKLMLLLLSELPVLLLFIKGIQTILLFLYQLSNLHLSLFPPRISSVT